MKKFEAVLWVNEEGSISSRGHSFLEAIQEARDFLRGALQNGWRIRGLEINEYDGETGKYTIRDG